ncbi:MAG: FAD-dependent oxidoreductase [Candidatus Veblenbacteria bacterium]|nr:FAD-dependent oxidoreductase [Candidatus Veblenbacteria bacterium]
MSTEVQPGTVYDTIIVGGGAAGLSAALYAGRYLMKTLVLEGAAPGGDTAVAWIVENYPGVPHVDGFELIRRMREQAAGFGATFASEEAAGASSEQHCFTVRTKGGTDYYSKTLILAHGEKHRHLGLPREGELANGKGLSYCVTCDGPLYKGKIIAIVGGGDSSVKGAVLAARYATHVYLITMEHELHAEPVNLEEFKRLENVTVLYDTVVTEFKGEPRLAGVKLSRSHEGTDELAVEGLFVEIGEVPSPELARSLGVALDEHGLIEVDPMMKTSVDGVYACGDTVNETGSFKQIVVGAAQGALAATSAYRDLGMHGGNACAIHARPAAHQPA